MATDPKADTKPDTKQPASIPADELKKAAESGDITKEDTIALVSKGADGKQQVRHFTPTEWKEFSEKAGKGEEKIPDGSHLVVLKDGKAQGDPHAVTQKAVEDAKAQSEAAEKQKAAAKDDLEKIGAEQKPVAAVVVVDKDGNTVSQKAFKTREEYEAFIKDKGKGVAVGEGQRAVFAEYDKDGKIVPGRLGTHQQPGQAGLEQGIAESEKEAEKARAAGTNKNWMETFMEKAMESGNMAIMALAALVMWASNRDGRGGEVGAEAGAGTGAPAPREFDGAVPKAASPGEIKILEASAEKGGMEKIQVTGNVTPEQVAAQFGLAGNADAVKAIAESMKANKGVVAMDVEGLGGTMPPPTPVASAAQGQTSGRT